MIVAAYNKNIAERMNSSSGAVFPLIAKKILKYGGIVYGVAFNDKYEIVHIAVENEKELPRLYGSKYAFSDCKVFPDVKKQLESGREVLFTGTPCQIAGIKAFLKQDYPNLYLMDNICHGTPPQKTWIQYLAELTGGKQIHSVSFRYKEKSWRHYRMLIKYQDGSEYNVDHDKDLYMRGFIDNFTLREGCFHCKFKGIDNRQSDITLGDLWGVWNLLPTMSDDKGTSLLFVNSEKGRRLLFEVQDQLEYTEIEAAKVIPYNASAVTVAKPNILKRQFDAEYKKTGKLIPSLKKYATPGLALKIRRKIYKITHKN